MTTPADHQHAVLELIGGTRAESLARSALAGAEERR